MTDFILTDQGLGTETQDEARTRIGSLFQGTFGDQIEIATDTVGGQLVDLFAELTVAAEQQVLLTYNSSDRRTATGVALDRLGGNIGIPRDGATRSSSEGTITGTPGTNIPNLSQVRLNSTNTVWEILGGPYVIPAGGIIELVPLQSQETGPITAIASGPTEWTIVDVVVGWDTWETTEDATPGQNQQSDKDYRASQDVGLFIRAQGPLLAITANVDVVEGVVTARTFHNPSLSPIDPVTLIPFKAINVVVETDPVVPTASLRQAIAFAIWNSSGAGVDTFGAESEVIIDSEGTAQTINFDLVANVNIFIEIDLTTSDEDEAITPNIDTVVAEFVAEQANIQFTSISDNVAEFKINGLVFESGATGITSVVVRLSTVGFSGPFDSPEINISIRQRADFDLLRIDVDVVP